MDKMAEAILRQRLRRPVLSRLLAKMTVDERTLCWIFNGAKNPKGYGSIETTVEFRKYRRVRPHRIAYETWVGPIPANLEIDHLCHNRACFNPDHLRAVDHITNVRNRRPANV